VPSAGMFGPRISAHAMPGTCCVNQVRARATSVNLGSVRRKQAAEGMTIDLEVRVRSLMI